MRGLVILVSALCLVAAQSPEERVDEVIDDLYDKIPKADSSVVTEIEINNYFAKWDNDEVGYRLDEDAFVAGWQADFGHSNDESAAWFRMFDVEWTDEYCVIDSFDIRVLVDTIGFFGVVTEEAFKAYLKVYFHGVGFAVMFNYYRIRGSGMYDDYISEADWSERIPGDADTDGNLLVSVDEFRAFFSPKYGTVSSADRAHTAVDFGYGNGDGEIDPDEWSTYYLALKSTYIEVYPELSQLHFEEFYQFSEAG